MSHFKIVLFAIPFIIHCLGGSLSLQAQINGYPPVSAKKNGAVNPLSPDPVMNYTWAHPKASDDLESYVLAPVSWVVSVPGSFDMKGYKENDVIVVSGPGTILFDFGRTNAGWLEFDSDDLKDSITMSISEYNEPAVVNSGAVHPSKTLAPVKHGQTYRLELNPELYEGVRFGWIQVVSHRATWHMKHFRLVCQTKPVNYQGSFSCSDPELTRIWYAGAYTVKLNLLKNYLGAILMERTDRFSWTGDAYVAQAASMVAFGNYDFVKANIDYTSKLDNGIASYALYWVLSLIDYVNYTGDTAFAKKYINNASEKLDRAYQHFGKSPKLGFYGWDERLGAGFENANIAESQYAYSMLSIRSWMEFSALMKQIGRLDLAKKFTGYAYQKIGEVRKNRGWQENFGIHAAADAINTGLTTPAEGAVFYDRNFTDRVNRQSYSPFNEYFIIGAMAKMKRYEDAVSTIKDCWGGQLRYGGTTFFEVYRPSWNAILGKNDAPPNCQCTYTSLTHPWSAGVVKWLSEEMLGIKPMEPGFRTFEIIPHLTDTITAVSGSTPTLQGRISADFDIRSGVATIGIPEGTRAKRIGMPLRGNSVTSLALNGKLVKFLQKDGYVYVNDLGPGKYEFKATYRNYRGPQQTVSAPWNYPIDKLVQDSVTSGNWKGRYGKEGFVLFNQPEKGKHLQKLPGYLSSVVLRNEANVHLDIPGDNSVLTDTSGNASSFGAVITQDPIPLLETMTIDLQVTGNQQHQVALYFLDWDNKARRSGIEVFDGRTLKLIAPVQLIRTYKGGKYLVFNYSGSIRIRVNQVRGPNAAVSGLFFDEPEEQDLKAVETGFRTAPDSIQTSVYWYWLSGNVSKEGVVKDLEAMKRVGINRAFIGDIGLGDVPYGKVKFLSDEWWDILHIALKTATQLNIKIGMFNGPGWSQAGGPWVRPEQAMRYLTSAQVMVKGPLLFNDKLVKPQGNFQDVKVLAYPVTSDYGADMSGSGPRLSSAPAMDSLARLMDHDEATGIPLTQGQQFSLDVSTPQPYTVRSVSISMMHQPVYLEGEIQAKLNNEYVTLKHFTIDRRAPKLQHGFIPWGRAVVSIPATTASNFRVLLTKVSGNSGISELKLSATPMVDSYMEKTMAKMWQTEDLVWGAYLWSPQPDEQSAYIIDPAKVVDISQYMAADGTLHWNVPPGDWVIERTGMTTTNTQNVPATPEATGLETDKMSKAHIAEHFDAYLGQILKRIPPEDRKTLTVVIADSYETGSQNWTDLLIPEFKKRYHYDATPFIPVLQGKIVGSADLSDRFLWDLRRLIADDVAYNYVAGLREVSHQHGLTTWLENYGYFGFPAEFLQYGGQSDEVAGEFWCEGHLGNVENKIASSAAHIYGKTKVSAESFTSAGNHWRRHPAMLKSRGDRFFADGINNTLLHVYIHQAEHDPKPGLNAWFGTEFNRANTWFSDMDLFVKYIKRCNLMLQQGQFVGDVAYFIGEDAPKMIGVTDPALPKGYSFDYINSEVIENSLSVKDGKLTLPSGISYSILVLPKLTTMRPELLSKIKELVQQGAVVLGPKPERSPSLEGYPEADKQVKTMADELWGNIDGGKNRVHPYGKGWVLSGMNMQDVLDLFKIIPDFTSTGGGDVLYIHRQLKGGSIYFISNQKNEPIDIAATFRIAGKKPELWDAVTGTVRNLPTFIQEGGGTSMPIHLAANGSAFVVFRKDGTKGDALGGNYPKAMDSMAIRGPWTVTFDSKMRGPEKPVIFNALTDWSQHSNDSIKYYSGAAYYRNVVSIKKIGEGLRYVIDLGIARDIAKVSVNGVEMGGAWTPPYEVDITGGLKPGDNKLEIKVVNTWVNRLLGDALLPAEQRKTTTLFGPDAGAGLESSGLLGPVKIDIYKY
ncbi:glycosyl hydrolase [Flavitalea sp. BT771]|uniref:glycosyl hydrolase n=1 Tax=Flavitalea sp. BT771 TaxID=3063329 RepID=UPI0026E19D17|nr:glycosyl hydrolase [Flavitalea sp. BT771]MDO6431952.1 glycosyl hydrolase [Flavitalea sp. BT771]